MTHVHKLLSRQEWAAAQAEGVFTGSEADLADGFIHFSAADQLAETARRHFAGQKDLICLSVESDGLDGLRWERSRGGALFPHLYGALAIARVVSAEPFALDPP